MPIFMDRHFIEGATRHVIADAHEKDIAIQERYGVRFLTYWFDELRSTAFCLVDAPDRSVIERAHAEAHGDVPHEIIEVDPAIVESFLGRVADPKPAGVDSAAAVDSAFRAIMFTDLEGSTQLTSTVGDSRALHLLHVHNAMVREPLRRCGGREVKHTGDGIMASFTLADDAAHCACAIQQAFCQHNGSHPGETMRVRIGASVGEPIEEHGDLFGRAVQLAARLRERAGAGQVLVTSELRASCTDAELSFDESRSLTLKGIGAPVDAHLLKW